MIRKLMKNKFIRKIAILFLDFMSLINKIIPKNEKQILFYDSGREYLDDNTEALFEYLKTNGFDKRYKLLVYVSGQKNTSPYDEYKNLNVFSAIWSFMRSKYVFYSFGDFRIIPSKKQIVVNQWHGTPLKRIGKMTYDANYQKERLDNFTYVISPSKNFSAIMAESFGCNEERILVLGNSRCDYLLNNENSLKLLDIKKNNYKKCILWMPTFRASNDGRFNDGDNSVTETMIPLIETFEKMEKLNSYLKKNNCFMVIKIHPLAVYKNFSYSNILIIKNEDLALKKIKLYSFVGEFDCLITDYSSIFCDYLLLNKPMAFIVDDADKYKNTRGFTLDPIDDYLPGHLIHNSEELFGFLDDIILEKDNYNEKRNKLLHFYNDDIEFNYRKKLIEVLGII